MAQRTKTLKSLYSLLIFFLFFSFFQIYNSYQKRTEDKASDKYSIYSDTLNVLASSNLTALSPYDAIFADDVFLINQVYQGLVKLDEYMSEEPDLADHWIVDSSHTHFTFHLKKNQLFHNGDTVNAEDVIASFEHFLKYETDSYIRPYFKVIKGAEEFWRGNSPHVSGIKKESFTTISIFLKHPYIPFLKLLSLPEAKIMPASVLRQSGANLKENPIGSGPYFIKRSSASSILLEAFHWNERKNKSVGVKYFKLWLNDDKIYERIQNNNFDISYNHIREFADSIGQFDSFHSPSLSLTFLGVNCQKTPTDNKMLRKALFYGINQNQVREEFGSIANPVNFYCPLNLPRESEIIPTQRYDFLKAKTFLNTAINQLNLTESPKLLIAVDSTLYSNTITNVVLRNFDSLGVPYKVNYYSGLSLKEEAKLIRDNNLFLFGWYMDVPDPEYFFDVLFNSDQSTNLMSYSSAVVDSLLNESYSEEHLEHRLRTYVKIESILMSDAPIVPLMNDFEEIVFRKSLKNVVFNRIGIVGLDLSKIRVNRTAHQKYLAQIKNAEKRS